MSAFGIDFGTSNCVVARYAAGAVDVLPLDQPPPLWASAGLDRLLPSVVAVGSGGDVRFGWEAKLGAAPRAEAVKRLFAAGEVMQLADRSFPVEEIGALIFGHLRRLVAPRGELTRAVVTVPANSRGLARYRTRLCARLAGIEAVVLINEPAAAAMAFGLHSGDDQTVLVVDWGGGTLDVTVLELTDGVFLEHASKGVQRLGGLDFDALIIERLAGEIRGSYGWTEADRAALRLEVERAKIHLSQVDEVTVALPGGDRRLLTREEFENWVAPLVQRAYDPVQRCLFDLGLSPSAVDHLVLVGGTCMMPAVRDFVSTVVGREPAAGVDPLSAVAQGAAVAAAILAGEHPADFFPATEHALGTVCLDAESKPTFSTIIPRNHKLPARGVASFTPVRDYERSVEVRVVEGDPGVPLDHEDNLVLGTWTVPLGFRTAAESSFDIACEYDVDGILHVHVTDRTTGKPLFGDSVSFLERLGPGLDLADLHARVAAALADG
jgi:molecular chaperone DnaK